MKFMKLGSKPDFFQADGDNIRYVATELATDVVVNVGDVKFYLHKFPLLSKSACMQKLATISSDKNSDEVHIHDIPGGPAAFEICAKFCYGMTVTLNAYNVVAARCAAEYLEMYEIVEKGNLIYKIEVFLNSSIFRSWKDSIIVLQTTKSLLTWSEELKLVSRCIDSIALKACSDTLKVEWSYTYNRKKLTSENGKDPYWNGVKKSQMVPKDWWVEDLCELQIDLYKRVITTIKMRGEVAAEVIGEALNAYATRRLPRFNKDAVQSGDIMKYKSLAETIVRLLPAEKGCVPCGFMLKLLRAAIFLECGEMEKKELMRRIGQQLEEAAVPDLLIQSPPGETTIYDVDIVQSLVEEFVAHGQDAEIADPMAKEFQESRSLRFGPDASKELVANLVEGYLTEIARDPNLPLSKFVNLAEAVSSFPRSSHDGLYRAIDMYLKEHPEISKSERKRICRLMDCRKLSVDAYTHVVQNERLPLRVVVQVLFFEQVRQATSTSGNTPELPGSVKALLPGGSHGSSSSMTTNTEEDWDSVPTAEDIKALHRELANLHLGGGGSNRNHNLSNVKNDGEKPAANKLKGLLGSKILSKLWSGKERNGEMSNSDTSSPGSMAAEGMKSTPPRSRRQSVS